MKLEKIPYFLWNIISSYLYCDEIPYHLSKMLDKTLSESEIVQRKRPEDKSYFISYEDSDSFLNYFK
jgi:hypothetical protein